MASKLHARSMRNRARQEEVLLAVATYNVRTLSVTRKNGYGHDEYVVAKGEWLDCDFVGLQETRISGRNTFCA